MNNRFEVCEMFVCPFTGSRDKYLTPKLEYPTRLCVIDLYKKIAIDVKHEVKYDYIEIINQKYFKFSNVYEKLENERRVAIIPLNSSFNNRIDFQKVNNITDRLANGEIFIDGNEVYSNDAYLQLALIEKHNDEMIRYNSNENNFNKNKTFNKVKTLKKNRKI